MRKRNISIPIRVTEKELEAVRVLMDKMIGNLKNELGGEFVD